MLYFRDEHWILINGLSRFSVYITSEDRKREDVSWSLALEYCAGGPIWRRVREWERPRFMLDLSSFKLPGKTWEDLEKINYWNLEESEEDDDVFGDWSAGMLDVHFYKAEEMEDAEWALGEEHVWRVAARHGRFFTVEMASLTNPQKWKAAAQVAVTPEGKEEKVEPDPEFWKKNSQLYLLENIPFGVVDVCVPRNVIDPLEYAIKRSQALVGTGQPEFYNLIDGKPKEGEIESWHSDIHVQLQFNGIYEE